MDVNKEIGWRIMDVNIDIGWVKLEPRKRGGVEW